MDAPRTLFYRKHQHGGIVWFTYTMGASVFRRFGRIVR